MSLTSGLNTTNCISTYMSSSLHASAYLALHSPLALHHNLINHMYALNSDTYAGFLRHDPVQVPRLEALLHRVPEVTQVGRLNDDLILGDQYFEHCYYYNRH